MHFFALQKIAKQSSLRICKENVELLTEREHLDITEPQVSVISVLESLLFTANNWYILTHDSKKPCFGGVMQLEKLPIADFALNGDFLIQEILYTAIDASIGYFFGVNRSFSPSPHDEQRVYFLTPTKDLDKEEWLRDYQIKLKEQHISLLRK